MVLLDRLWNQTRRWKGRSFLRHILFHRTSESKCFTTAAKIYIKMQHWYTCAGWIDTTTWLKFSDEKFCKCAFSLLFVVGNELDIAFAMAIVFVCPCTFGWDSRTVGMLWKSTGKNKRGGQWRISVYVGVFCVYVCLSAFLPSCLPYHPSVNLCLK